MPNLKHYPVFVALSFCILLIAANTSLPTHPTNSSGRSDSRNTVDALSAEKKVKLKLSVW